MPSQLYVLKSGDVMTGGLTLSAPAGLQVEGQTFLQSLKVAASTSTESLGVSFQLGVSGQSFLIGRVDFGNSNPDPNDPQAPIHTFLQTGEVGFFAAIPAPQQSATTLLEVIAALRAYGLLAP